jgi:hypothetical protein
VPIDRRTFIQHIGIAAERLPLRHDAQHSLAARVAA